MLIAGVGYRNLRDFSVGPHSVDRLAVQEWPAHVEVEDLSYNPISVVHRMRDQPEPYARLVAVASMRRGGRPPGSVAVYRWNGRLPDPEHVQARVAEAVTGVIDLDNLLVVLAQFEALPSEVVVVEVEPEVEDWGDELTEPVERALDEVLRVARRMALAERLDGLPMAALGGIAAAT